MRLLPILILFFSCNLSLNAQSIDQDSIVTSVDFRIKNIGMYVNGNFNEISIKSNFNSQNLKDSYINAIIKVSSINTKNEKRDKHLLKNDFFDAAKYPEIKLTSTKIEKISDNKYKLSARLIIKNITKDIEIPLDFQDNDKSIIIKSSFKLNRREFNVGGSSWILSNTVKIKVAYTLEK